MLIYNHYFISLLALFISCDTGNLEILCSLPSDLKEVSGTVYDSNNSLIWLIEDQGNSDHLYAINQAGEILEDINLNKNVENEDWEEITIDSEGYFYIGDIGNNGKKNKSYTIYKTPYVKNHNEAVSAEKITFTLPHHIKPTDFEAFVLYRDAFYLFSKKSKRTEVYKVPNKVGAHEAKFLQKLKFDDEDSAVTGAAISPDNSKLVLLNHEKLYLFETMGKADITLASPKILPFNHSSQKEGVTFVDNQTLYITDERTKGEGGNLYSFSLR